MNRFFLYIFLLIALCSGCFATKERKPSIQNSIATLAEAAGSTDQKESLKKIADYYANAKFNKDEIFKAANMVYTTNNNIPVLVKISEYLSRVSFQTMVLSAVAEAAAVNNFNTDEFLKIAELAVIKLSSSQDIIDLANQAASSNSQANKADLNKKIQSFYETAECKSVEEAIQKNEEMINKINEMVKTQKEAINK